MIVQDPEYLGFFAKKNDVDIVAEAVSKKYGGKVSAWKTKIAVIYPVYRDSVMKGDIMPFTLRSGTPQKTVKLIAERCPYSATDILNYLETLERLTREGTISGEWWDPSAHLQKLEKTKKFWEEVKRVSPVKPSIFAPLAAPAKAFGTAVNKGVSSGLTFGILALTGYFIIKLQQRKN